VGLLVAAELRPGRPAAAGGLLAILAVGCPVCNKPVLLLAGTSGALGWFAALQPVLAALAIALLVAALVARLRAESRCCAGQGVCDE
jgi:hypothetical protein